MFNTLLTDLVKSSLAALRQNPKLRLGILIGASLVLLVSLVIYMGRSFWVPELSAIAHDAGPAVLLFSGVLLFLTLASFGDQTASPHGLEHELNSIREARRELTQRIAENRGEAVKADETVLDTIQLSLNQITEYYTINKSQARSSFRFSVLAMVVGLGTLIAGVWFAFFQESPDKQLGLVTAISGLLIQFISGAYFWMHQKSLAQLNFFYEKLVKMQDTMLAIQLADTLPDEQQHDTKRQLIEQLIARSSESVLRPNLGKLTVADSTRDAKSARNSRRSCTFVCGRKTPALPCLRLGRPKLYF